MTDLSPHPFEYRWRLGILIASQPVFAYLVGQISSHSGKWYDPEFSPALAITAATLTTFGLFLRIWSATYLSTWVMGSRDPETRQLIQSGPFHTSRNPLYVGTLLMFFGYGLFFGILPAVCFALFHWYRYERMIQYEERHLREEWGSRFADYCEKSPRWFSFRTGISFTGPWFSWEGILGNLFFVGMWVGCLLSAIFDSLLPVIPAEIAGGVLMAGYYLLHPPSVGAELTPQHSESVGQLP